MKPWTGKLQYRHGEDDDRTWTAKGSLSFIIRAMFENLPEERRGKVLAKLQAKHDKLTRKEGGSA